MMLSLMEHLGTDQLLKYSNAGHRVNEGRNHDLLHCQLISQLAKCSLFTMKLKWKTEDSNNIVGRSELLIMQ